jgi:hypothetical protein
MIAAAGAMNSQAVRVLLVTANAPSVGSLRIRGGGPAAVRRRRTLPIDAVRP